MNSLRPLDRTCAPRPYGLLAELTHRCPLHCPYCSNPLELAARADEMSAGDWERVIREAAELGVVQLGLSGGEPLLYRDLTRLVHAARAEGLYSNLITSGLGLSRARMAGLSEAGLDTVQISFQANESLLGDAIAGTHSHALKIEAARVVVEAGLPLGVNVVLHRSNIERLPAIIRLVESLGAMRLELANTQFYGWAFRNRHSLLPTLEQVLQAEATAKAEASRLVGKMQIVYVLPDYYEKRPKPCLHGWGSRSLTVNPRGDVLPCQAANAIPDLVFDNVREKSLGWIWRESDAFGRFRGFEWMPDPCRSCDFREIDFGGCRCQAALLAGDAVKADPVCEFSPDRPVVDAILAGAGGDEAGWVYRG
jgi:PqqA peptide cyclase